MDKSPLVYIIILNPELSHIQYDSALNKLFPQFLFIFFSFCKFFNAQSVAAPFAKGFPFPYNYLKNLTGQQSYFHFRIMGFDFVQRAEILVGKQMFQPLPPLR